MKILLVDDSKSARYALRLQLQRHGAEVEVADSAEAAFEVLKSQIPDAILMDHMMPGLNGFEALDVIRKDPRTAQIPVVMCTSHEEPEFVATAQQKGVFGILPKSAAADLLPGIMEQLQSKLSDLQAQAAARVAQAPVPPAPPALSKAEIAKLVDTQVDARLGKILPSLLEELRRDLTESILNESRHLLEERFAAEQAAQRTAPPKPTMADLQAISTRLATETLPDLIRRSLDTERSSILEAVDKQLREVRSRGGSEVGAGAASDLESKAAVIARHASQQTVDAALQATQQAIQAVEQAQQRSMGLVYGLVVGAALLGVGAAVAVYLMLGG